MPSNTNYLYKIAQAQLDSIALTIAIQVANSTGEWDAENPWVSRIKGRFAKSGSDAMNAISEAAKFGADAALAEAKSLLASDTAIAIAEATKSKAEAASAEAASFLAETAKTKAKTALAEATSFLVGQVNTATSKASEEIAKTLSPITSAPKAVISTIQDTSTQITESVLTGADNISGGSDLGSAILGSEVASERIGRIGDNLSQLASDVSSITLAGFAIAAEKVVEADTGRDIKSMGDIKEEFAKSSDFVMSEESAFLSSQGDGLKNLAERVSNSVTPFFTTNVEAYYEERSEVGENQQAVVREILQRAKERNAIK